MSEGRAAATAAHRVGSGAGRLLRAWRNLTHERRLAAYAAIGLFLSLFLPWYQETGFVANASKTTQPVSQSLNGWGAFSFVEAAVLLVALGVLTLLFQRAEGRAFHLPGGDGWVIMAAGFWTSLLVIWRIFDKQGTSSRGLFVSSSGIEWGIFVALGVAVFLAYAGSRVRAANQPEPPLPGEDAPRPPARSLGEDARSPGSGEDARSPSWSSGDARSPSRSSGDDAPRSPSRSSGDDAPRSPSRSSGDDAPRSPGSEGGAPPGPGSEGGAPPGPGSGEDASGSPRSGDDGSPGPESLSMRRAVGWLSAPPGDRPSGPGWREPETQRSWSHESDPQEPDSQGPRPREPSPQELDPQGPRPREPSPRELDPQGPRPREPSPQEADGEPRPFRAPAPHPTGNAPAQAEPHSDPPPAVPPSTPAARRRTKPDEPLTIPLEPED